jgi:hypothetical protein
MLFAARLDAVLTCQHIKDTPPRWRCGLIIWMSVVDWHRALAGFSSGSRILARVLESPVAPPKSDVHLRLLSDSPCPSTSIHDHQIVIGRVQQFQRANAPFVRRPDKLRPCGFASARLPLDFRRNVMPNFKEALHNIIKHAGSTKVENSVCRTRGGFEFVVQDDGRGFALLNRPTGNGLKNIRRRSEGPLGNQQRRAHRHPDQTHREYSVSKWKWRGNDPEAVASAPFV